MGSGQGGGGWLPTGGNGSQTCHLSQGPADETHSLPAAPEASGRGPHSSPQAQEQQEDGGRVSAADACGGNMKTWPVASLRPTAAAPALSSGVTGTRSPTAGEKPRPGIFSGWFVARVNLGFDEPALGQVTP